MLLLFIFIVSWNFMRFFYKCISFFIPFAILIIVNKVKFSKEFYLIYLSKDQFFGGYKIFKTFVIYQYFD